MLILHNLAQGFGIALTPLNLLYCVIGATLGTLVGVLPGIGAPTAMAMLLPITFKLSPVGAIIMLCGIYYGAHHAGSTTAIMLNMPGEPSSVAICLDGYPMARQGRAGPALCISALGSFFAGCVATLVIAMFSPVLADAALYFRGPEYASMIVLALVAIAVISSRSVISTISMAVLGLLLGTIGTDISSGVERLTFHVVSFYDGLGFVTIAVSFFALAHIIVELTGKERQIVSTKVNGLLPTRSDLRSSWRPILRGTALGSIMGIFPGTGPLVSSFAAYALEKRMARDPSRFGHGAIEGVAGPESANNAAALTHFIPMLTLGIPAGAAMALVMGALMIQGIAPGPDLIGNHPDVFWGVIASMWIGNLMLLVLNLPLIGIWLRLLTVPFRLLYPLILVCCCVGIYSVENSSQMVLLAGGLALFGFILAQCGCAPAPLVLGFILEPILEENLRRSLALSRGDPTIFVTRPVSLILLLLAASLLLTYSAPALRQRLSLRLLKRRSA